VQNKRVAHSNNNEIRKKKTGGKIDAFQTRDSAYKHCFFPSCVCVVVGVFVFASFLLANTGLF